MTNTHDGCVERKRVSLSNAGRGVHRKLVHLGDAGRGVHRQRGQVEWFQALADRLRDVRVCCGDWSRVCGPTPTVKQGLTGVLLDPPYGDDTGRQDDLYAEDSNSVAEDVRAWAIANGGDHRLRIALCGYDTEHAMPAGWTAVGWKARGGYGSQGGGAGRTNAARETIWFSPHCLRVGLFDQCTCERPEYPHFDPACPEHGKLSRAGDYDQHQLGLP